MVSLLQKARAPRALLVGLLVASITTLAPGSSEEATAQTSGKDPWTILLYSVADTDNIEIDLLETVEKLAEVGSTDEVNVIAMVDRAPDQTAGPLLNIPNWDTAKIFRVHRGELEELADVGEVDMGDGNTFAWFLAEGMKLAPAERYGVFVDDHGGGVSGFGWDLSTELATGEPSNLKIDEISHAIAAALANAGEDKIDLFGYLACLMATYDAAAQLAPHVDYLAASEEVTYGPQAWLDGMMEVLVADPAGVSVEALGAEIVQVTEDLDQILRFPERTQSLLDLRQIPHVTQALDAFAVAVTAALPAIAPEIGRALSATPQFGAVGGGDPYPLFDLGVFLANLQNVPPQVAVARDSLYQAVTSSVADVFNGPIVETVSGMSIYFPPTADLFAERYPQVAGAPAWAEMLQAYYSSPQDIIDDGGTGQLALATTELQLDLEPDGVVAVATLAPGSEQVAVGASFYGGVAYTDGTTGYLFSMPAVVGSGDARSVAMGWDFTYAQLTDGTASLDGFTDMQQTSTGYSASMPILYQLADGRQFDGWLQFGLDDAGALLPGITILLETDGGFATVTPEPGDLIAPQVLVASGGQYTFELVSSEAVDATAVAVTVAQLPSSTVFATSIEVFDAAGNVVAATATNVVP